MIYISLISVSLVGILICIYLLRNTINLRALLISMTVIGSGFTILDYFMIGKAWNFNSVYISGIFIMNIPIEEIMFFMFIPAVVYLMSNYLPNLSLFRYLNVAIVLTLLIIITIYGKGIYSNLMLLLGTIILFLYFHTQNLDHIVILGFLLFIPFNFFLTYFPVVIYYPNSFSGIRFLSIPIEDFVFNFVMIVVFGILYEYLKERL
ncbi:MAG: lycopene cyclase domain-containing protein [Candidatus Micrarchaeota archaeon]|nr:lycopene cyclase domain-containing protein [Candidatus Micrarchaeota archaeon]